MKLKSSHGCYRFVLACSCCLAVMFVMVLPKKVETVFFYRHVHFLAQTVRAVAPWTSRGLRCLPFPPPPRYVPSCSSRIGFSIPTASLLSEFCPFTFSHFPRHDKKVYNVLLGLLIQRMSNRDLCRQWRQLNLLNCLSACMYKNIETPLLVLSSTGLIV